MAAQPAFETNVLERLCAVLADTSTGLTGSEIGRLLARLGIADPAPSFTKRVRLFEALQARQQQDHFGNQVIALIQESMNPARYTGNPEQFDNRRTNPNVVLAFAGLELAEDGKLRAQTAATTLNEAEQRAGRLQHELRRRTVHHEVLRFCRAELVAKNCFHAVLEATKSLADSIRTRTGLTADGAELVDQAFGTGKAGIPYLAFNTLQTDIERSEQSGLMNLMKGLFGTFRNPTAHAPKISWTITEQDALDLLTMVSFLHRRLDEAARTPRQ